MYTANTMASAIEALGMSVPYSSSIPAWEPSANGGAGGLHADKIAEVDRAVAALQVCVRSEHARRTPVRSVPVRIEPLASSLPPTRILTLALSPTRSRTAGVHRARHQAARHHDAQSL
jgi:IS5 family transposase